MDKNKIAILITTYCDNEIRHFMTETICEKLSKFGYHICLTSHTLVTEKALKYCNSFLYDADNSTLVDGRNTMTNNTPAETTCMNMGLDYLQSKGFTHVFKTNYDVNPSIDINKIIETHASKNKKLVATTNGDECAMLSYFGEISFIKETWNFDMLRKYGFDNIAEMAWKKYIREKGWLDDVCMDYKTDGQLLLIGEQRVNFYHAGGMNYLNEYKTKI